MTWTAERVEQLKALWKEGYSASQVAAKIGDVTRNAVIGKIHRLGMAERATTKSVNAPRRARNTVKKKVVQPASKAKSVISGNLAVKIDIDVESQTDFDGSFNEFVAPGNRKTLQQLTEHTCKWPIGHPGDDDFYFCGRPKALTGPYCEHHAERAYQQVERKKPKS